jgi:hypothetical protein
MTSLNIRDDADQRNEGQGREETVVTEALRCVLVVMRGMEVLDRTRVLTDLFAADLVEVVDAVMKTDHGRRVSGYIHGRNFR